MKIKTILYSVIFTISFLCLVSCSDELTSIGSDIQPGGDGIFVGADTVFLTAKTISMKDSIFARTTSGALGEYIDPILGSTKSDYLFQYYCPNGLKFVGKDRNKIVIDSVVMTISVDSAIIGNRNAPMGLSIYRVNTPLKGYFYTNVDPTIYCDMSTTLGRGVFVANELGSYYSTKHIKIKMNNSYGQEFLNQWKQDSTIFASQEKLNNKFKGVYITNTFGNSTLAKVNSTRLNIYYNYQGRNHDNTKDSTKTETFTLTATNEVIQMNHIKNDIPSSLLTDAEAKTKTYLKTPAGLYTELTVPLADIINSINNKTEIDSNLMINIASFRLKGYSDLETQSGLSNPSNLLIIDKDSINGFFEKNDLTEFNKGQTSILVTRTAATNTYDLGNMATIISHYVNIYKDKTSIPDIKFLVIPVEVVYSPYETSSGSVTTKVTSIYNLMYPSGAILRSDRDNLKMTIIYSKYNR